MREFLSAIELLELKEAHLAEKNKRQADRIKTVLLLNEGWSYEKIAKVLLLDDETCRRYYREYKEKGLDELLEDKYKGGESKLGKEEEIELKRHLSEKVYYSAQSICEYVKEKYGISYSKEGMVHVLHRLEFSYKKLTKIPGKSDVERQKEFIEAYERLKESKKEKERIYFMDGVHPQHNVEAGWGWIEKGKEKEVRTNTGRRRINLNGAYSVEDQEIIIRKDEAVNAQSTIKLFKEIEDKHPESENIYVISDNAKYYHSKLVKEYLLKSRIKMIFLPSYSPNLNLIERLWKFYHKKVRRKYYEAYDDFQKATMSFFNNLHEYKSELSSLITENFHIIGQSCSQT